MKAFLTILTIGALSLSAFAETKSQDVVVTIDTKTVRSSKALLEAMEVISQGVFVEDSKVVGGVCAATAKIKNVVANPIPESPVQDPYLFVNITWNCTKGRDRFVANIKSIPGLKVLSRNSLNGPAPGVVRSN